MIRNMRDSVSSYSLTLLGVLTGVSLGYLFGVIKSKWLQREEERPQAQHPGLIAAVNNLHRRRNRGGTGGMCPPNISAVCNVPHPAPRPYFTSNCVPPQSRNLPYAYDLTAEMPRLHQSLELSGFDHSSQRPLHTAEGVPDFISAQGSGVEPESDEEETFFDANTPPNTDDAGEGQQVQSQEDRFDELGKKTLESVEVCGNLIKQLRAALEERPHDVGLLWRLARALVHLSYHQEERGDSEKEKELLQEAMEHAQQALNIDSGVWQSHQWYAVATGTLSKFEGIQRKIQRGHEYKEHIDIAISLHPDEPTLHNLRGNWCFQVARLSWLERKAAAVLFAAPPESSYEEAFQSFMKAEEFLPDQWKANVMMIGKCHIKFRDVPTAIEWLHKAFNLPVITSEDVTAQKEIVELLLQHDETFTTE